MDDNIKTHENFKRIVNYVFQKNNPENYDRTKLLYNDLRIDHRFLRYLDKLQKGENFHQDKNKNVKVDETNESFILEMKRMLLFEYYFCHFDAIVMNCINKLEQNYEMCDIFDDNNQELVYRFNFNETLTDKLFNVNLSVCERKKNNYNSIGTIYEDLTWYAENWCIQFIDWAFFYHEALNKERCVWDRLNKLLNENFKFEARCLNLGTGAMLVHLRNRKVMVGVYHMYKKMYKIHLQTEDGLSDSLQEEYTRYLKVNDMIIVYGIMANNNMEIITALVDKIIKDKVKNVCQEKYEKSCFNHLVDWLYAVLIPWLVTIYAPYQKSSKDYTNLMYRQQYCLKQRLYLEFSNLRFSQILFIVLDYPESIPTIQDLKKSVAFVGLNNENIIQLRKLLSKKLLHPGVKTEDILMAYVSAVKAFEMLDPTGVLLNLVYEPLRTYLRHRKDTLQCIVQSLIDEESDLKNELIRILQTKNVKPTPKNEDEEEMKNFDKFFGKPWNPKPACDKRLIDRLCFEDLMFKKDVLNTKHLVKNKNVGNGTDLDEIEYNDTAVGDDKRKYESYSCDLDIIDSLIHIFGNLTTFMKQFHFNFAENIVSRLSYDQSINQTTLELIEAKFGAKTIHKCKVMVKDIVESMRMKSCFKSSILDNFDEDLCIQFKKICAELGLTEKNILDTNHFILSYCYWPKSMLKDENEFVLHDAFTKIFNYYQTMYIIFKSNQKLNICSSQGNTTLKITMSNGDVRYETLDFCSSSILMHISDKKIISLMDLLKIMKIDEQALRIKLKQLMMRNLIMETETNMYEEYDASIARKNDVTINVDEVYQKTKKNLGKKNFDEMIWKYVTGMLTSMKSMNLSKILSMLKFFVDVRDDSNQSGDFDTMEFSEYIQSITENKMENFLNSKINDGQVELKNVLTLPIMGNPFMRLRLIYVAKRFNSQNKNINNAMKIYLDNVRDKERFMQNEEKNFAIGKKHLAKMMNATSDDLTQAEINKHIAYLLPSGLMDNRAIPFMKPPQEYIPRIQAIQFDYDGRPFKNKFYTLFPNFYDMINKVSTSLFELNNSILKCNGAIVVDEIKKKEFNESVSSSVEMTLEGLVEKFMENLTHLHFDQYKKTFNRLIQHPLGYQYKDLILKYRIEKKTFDSALWLPQVQIEEKTQRQFVIAQGARKTCKCTLKFYPEGTGKITINGKSMWLFVKSIPLRNQLLLPLQMTNRIGTCDFDVTVSETDLPSEMGSIRLALSRAIAAVSDSETQLKMKLAGLLTRDPRMRERKKPGQEGARRKYTWKRR
ncbi:hypothetical protein A3Q56_03074 [Intoshia linei]|uniref:Anaphase-promoting complex subunit 2 n=1 Tax=Intoshia linei TaxID=1819745 RepID=A0A177B4H6_9BILA|nr:hypothetical protein A3Q56_03074 [Intoshia linei]